METCEEHSSLNQGGSGKRKYTKRSDYWSSKTKEEEEEEVIESEAESEDSDESENEAEQTVSMLKGGGGRSNNAMCRVGGCPKYHQSGRDGMCAAHFNAVKLYGIKAVLSEGIEVGAVQTKIGYSARKKHTNKKKSRRSSSESPQKLRAKRTKQDAETTSANPRKASPKRKKPVKTAEQLPPSRLLEKELGLPKYDNDSSKSKCIVGACSLEIQIPRQYRMCRKHYRELVDGESKEQQKKFAEYALLVRPPKSPGVSPSKFSSKKSSKSNARARKRKMSTDGTEGVAAKTKRRRAMTNMPAVVDDRRAPDTTEEAVALVSAQVRDIWKVLPSEIDLNSPPPISEPVFFGDIAAEYSNYGAKPVLDENSALEDEAFTKKDDLKALGVEFVDLDPKMNYNIIHLAVKARLAAENYTSALSLCQKALLDWYDLAEKCARFHLDDPPEGAIDSNVSSMRAVCDSLAGLWCVYAWLLQELVALNSSRSPSNPDDASMATETDPSPPPSAPSSSSPSSDGKFLPGTVIPEGLFKVSHDHVQWSDVLAALKIATGCHLSGQRAWPWLARARATVRSSEAATGMANMSSLPSTAASDTGNQTNASDLVLKGYGDAVAICREGIGRVSSLPTVQSAKSRKLLVPTSIQDVTLPYFGQENTRALCRETNHMFDMKCRVENAVTSQNDNAGDAAIVMNGAPKDEKAQDTSHQSKTNNNQSDSTLSAFHAVEWVCNGCAEYFTDKDALRSHKKECPEKAVTAIDEKASQTAAKEMPLACNVSRAPIFCETEAMDVLDYLVEIFPATKDDMGRRNGGRPAKVHTEGGDESIGKNSGLLANIPTFEGQVGLRCIHCRDDGGISGVVFPPTIADLPRAMYRMQVSHFERCACLPDDCRARYEVMRNSVAPDGFGSKRYWNEVAEGLNLQDTTNGMMWPAGNTTASAAVEKASVRFDGSV